MGDINFGVFSVALDGTQTGHDALLRWKADRAEVSGRGGPALTSGTDRQVVWRPSPQERKKHPDLPADACVRGRLIVQQVNASNGDIVTMYLFSTLDLSLDRLSSVARRPLECGNRPPLAETDVEPADAPLPECRHDRQRVDPGDYRLSLGASRNEWRPWRHTSARTGTPATSLQTVRCGRHTRGVYTCPVLQHTGPIAWL